MEEEYERYLLIRVGGRGRGKRRREEEEENFFSRIGRREKGKKIQSRRTRRKARRGELNFFM